MFLLFRHISSDLIPDHRWNTVSEPISSNLIPEIWNAPKWKIYGKSSFNSSPWLKKFSIQEIWNAADSRIFGKKLIQYFTKVEKKFQFNKSQIHQIQEFWAKTHSIIHHGWRKFSIFNLRDLKCTRWKGFGQKLIQYFTMVEENV